MLNAMTWLCVALTMLSAPGGFHPEARIPDNGDVILRSAWSDAGLRMRAFAVDVLTSGHTLTFAA